MTLNVFGQRFLEMVEYDCDTHTVTCLAVLPDGRLASGSYDNTVRVWDVSDGGSCALTQSGHTNYVSSLTVLPDGRLVSGSYDATLRVWS